MAPDGLGRVTTATNLELMDATVGPDLEERVDARACG
jgi:hypothetical protein